MVCCSFSQNRGRLALCVLDVLLDEGIAQDFLLFRLTASLSTRVNDPNVQEWIKLFKGSWVRSVAFRNNAWAVH